MKSNWCKHARPFDECIYCNPAALKKLLEAIDRHTQKRERAQGLRRRERQQRRYAKANLADPRGR
jgi:hypothetical protein